MLAPKMLLTTCVERMQVPPYGVQDGQPGAIFRLTLDRDGTSTALNGKANFFLQQGDLITIETCGGGGYGHAA